MTPLPHFQPPGFHTVTPSLTIKGAAEAIAFYQRALGATELYRIAGPDGVVMHAELQVGDCRVMLSDEFPSYGVFSPKTLGGTGSSLMLYVPDVDASMAQAVAAGGTQLGPVNDEFWGDRMGRFEDPYGHRWSLATHTEDVPPEEISRRAAAWTSEYGSNQ